MIETYFSILVFEKVLAYGILGALIVAVVLAAFLEWIHKMFTKLKRKRNV